VVDIQTVVMGITLPHPRSPMFQRNLVQQFYSEDRSSMFLYHTNHLPHFWHHNTEH